MLYSNRTFLICRGNRGAHGNTTLALLVVLLFVGASRVFASPKSPRVNAEAPEYPNTAPSTAYLGSNVCGQCHGNIVRTYLNTGMGRSMSLVSPSLLASIPASATLFKPELNRNFRVFQENSKLYVSEYEPDAKGGTVFNNTQQIDYAIGAGANGLGLLIFRNNFLLEAPVSYYATTRSWALSPGSGYENSDIGFSRAAPIECVACHSGRADPVPERRGQYHDPPFRELAIGCENCHGPGDLHVQERRRGQLLSGAVDRSIVNPAKLPPWLANNICMYCHQAGEATVLQPGRSYVDFRPGTPLDSTLALFQVPLNRQSNHSPLLQHYFLMTLSKCYQASGGKLTCITCHDPHVQPSPEEAPGYYRKKCLSCHAENSCKLPLQARLRNNPPDNCAGCHLPKREAHELQHAVALTDHRIPVTRGEPYPDAAFRETGPNAPGLIHLSLTPGNNVILPLTLTKAYGQLVEKQFNEYRQPYLTMLSKVARTDPDDAYVLEALAMQEMQATAEGYRDATKKLARAIELGSISVTAYQTLSDLLIRSNQVEQAIQLLKRALELNPYSEATYRSLADLYSFTNRQTEAAATLNQALKLFPQDASLREALKEFQSIRSRN